MPLVKNELLAFQPRYLDNLGPNLELEIIFMYVYITPSG